MNEGEEAKKKCFLCNADGLMAVFGVLAGVVILAMSVDLIRRMRMPSINAPEEVTSDE